MNVGIVSTLRFLVAHPDHDRPTRRVVVEVQLIRLALLSINGGRGLLVHQEFPVQDVVRGLDDDAALFVRIGVLLLRPQTRRVVAELQPLVFDALFVPVRHEFQLPARLPLVRPAVVLVRVAHVEVRHALRHLGDGIRRVLNRLGLLGRVMVADLIVLCGSLILPNGCSFVLSLFGSRCPLFAKLIVPYRKPSSPASETIRLAR